MKALLRQLTFVGLTDGVVTVHAVDQASLERAKRRRAEIESAFSEALGQRVRLRLETQGGSGGESPEIDEDAQRVDKEAIEQPLVRQAMELFDAKVVRIERTGKSGRAGDAARDE